MNRLSSWDRASFQEELARLLERTGQDRWEELERGLGIVEQRNRT